MKITFLHPDLGIGGAERLVVDAAIALRNRGHDVKIVTNNFSKNHCFTDLLPFYGLFFKGILPKKLFYHKDLNLDDIEVIGGFPRTLFGRCYALCAFIRICFAAVFICLNHEADIVFCDQVNTLNFNLSFLSLTFFIII